jgi:hypothetical protein
MANAPAPIYLAGHADVRAKRVCFILLLMLITFLEGVRVGGTPLPSSLALCLMYGIVFNPRIPKDVGGAMAVVFICIILICLRNSAEASGTIRDFLFIGTVVESFLLSVCMVDMTQDLAIRDISKIVLVIVCAELGLQLLEYSNLFGFENIIRPLLSYWNAMDNSSYAGLDYSLRAPGSFGSPTAAGFISYLMIRTLALLTRRRWIIYLAIIPMVICGARTALAIFLLWEVIIPLFSPQYRKYGFYALGAILAGTVGVIMFYPALLERLFVISFFIEIFAKNQLTTTDSVFYRMYGAQWALSRPLLQWIIGGMTAQQSTAYATDFYTFDSEFIQRCMQYGLVGYCCLIAMNLCAGFDRKNLDWWFGVALVLAGSTANYIATSVIIFPFLILYNVCLRRMRDEEILRRVTSQERPRRSFAVG